MECSNETIDNADSIVTEKMKQLQNALHIAVKEIVEGVSYEEFRTAIGKLRPFKNKTQLAHKLHGKLNAAFVDNATQRLNEILVEEDLNKKFSELSTLTENNAAHENEIAWRPPGNVEKHMRAPVIAEKLKHIERLKWIVEEKEKSVEFLATKVTKARDQVQLQMKMLDQLQDAAKISESNTKIAFAALSSYCEI